MENDIEEFDANKTYKEITYSKKWEENRSKEYFEYRKNWIKYPQEKIISDFPLHLDIETTNVCNLKCPMCPRTILLEKNEFSSQGYMNDDDYKNIIDQAVENGVKSIKLNYLGEPLLHPSVVWQVKYAKEKGILDVMMNSNGDLLTEKMSKELLEAGLDKIFISFDSISPDIYEIQRKGTSLGKVIDNVYNFALLRNQYYPNTHIRLSMVMYETPEYKAQFEGLQVMWKNLVDAVGYGFYTERDYEKGDTYPKVDGFYCEQLFQRMFLKYNGNVTVCCFDDKDEYVVGKWKDEKLKDIWISPAYKNIRDTHTKGNYCDVNMCSKCYLPVSD
jgi:radical SAM protein with 4Fe4S-binding SPASM domain